MRGLTDVLFGFFNRKKNRESTNDIARLEGATIALEEALILTLIQFIVGGGGAGHREAGMTRDDLINHLVKEWEEAGKANQVVVSISPSMQEGYLQIHNGFLKVLRSLKPSTPPN